MEGCEKNVDSQTIQHQSALGRSILLSHNFTPKIMALATSNPHPPGFFASIPWRYVPCDWLKRWRFVTSWHPWSSCHPPPSCWQPCWTLGSSRSTSKRLQHTPPWDPSSFKCGLGIPKKTQDVLKDLDGNLRPRWSSKLGYLTKCIQHPPASSSIIILGRHGKATLWQNTYKTKIFEKSLFPNYLEKLFKGLWSFSTGWQLSDQQVPSFSNLKLRSFRRIGFF